MGRVNRRRDRWLKRALEAGLRPFFRRPQMSIEQIRAEHPRRILIVRQHNQMGDMLCAVPALRALREAFPGARTMLVTAPVNDGVVRGNPYLDQILLFDKVAVRHSPAAAWRFLRTLRAFRPDLAVVLNSVSYSGTSSWIAVLSGTRRVMGGESRPFGWTFSEWLYNLTLPSTPRIEGHAIDHSLAPLASVGITTADRSTVIVPDEAAVVAARTFLERVGPPPRAAVHPGAGKAQNRWPADRMAAAIAQLQHDGMRVYLIEGPADREATAQTLAALGAKVPVLREVDVQTVASALQRTQLALVNDTGVMHVAGAMGTPTVALFGPTAAATWQPPSPALRALQSPDGSMEGLSTAAVLAALRDVRAAAPPVSAPAAPSAAPPRR